MYIRGYLRSCHVRGSQRCRPPAAQVKKFSVLEKSVPELLYSSEYMTHLTESPALIRNVCVAGHFHHGQ